MQDHIKLPSGRIIDANRDIVGIDCDGELFEGYDSRIPTHDLTATDRIYLAELMIARWEAYRDALVSAPNQD